ncbi:MAG: hypothetical protein OXU20_11945 [Myxococcales bacterium]|nr:hypothetical protein [Myxococcales bacterium]MDD9965786.1 hypothetical protein [Myxococcales bacterium]
MPSQLHMMGGPTREPGGWLVSLSTIVALSAVIGGIELVLAPGGSTYVSAELLRQTPFETFLVPGLLLLATVGVTAMASAVLLVRRSPVALDAAMLAGGMIVGWIMAELAVTRTFQISHAAHAALGLSLLGLAARTALRAGDRRHRWFLIVTAMEALGFLAPALTGVLLQRLGASEATLALWVSLAGFVEGWCLGMGQARALPVQVARWRFAMLSGLAAMAVWALVMGAMVMTQAGASIPMVIAIPAGALCLGAIGGAQWFELRRHAARAYRWVFWSAVAWAVALPLSFLPGPLVDEATPLANQIVLWACGGCLMAYAMTAITWQGVRRLWPTASAAPATV